MPETILHLGDNTQLDHKQKITALVSDPPYGGNFDTDYTRFSGGLSPSRNHHQRSEVPLAERRHLYESKEWQGIVGDNQPFDPTPWLKYPKVVLFGYQFFAQHLPLGTTLVWNKKRPNQLGTFLSDAELAWQKGGKGVYLFNHVWHGFDRETERGKTLHPSQKPVALFEWIYKRLKLKPGQWVYDPFMGCGASGVAAMRMGLNFVGAEIVPAYFEIAQERIKAEGNT